jgi:hypothetical protein
MPDQKGKRFDEDLCSHRPPTCALRRVRRNYVCNVDTKRGHAGFCESKEGGKCARRPDVVNNAVLMQSVRSVMKDYAGERLTRAKLKHVINTVNDTIDKLRHQGDLIMYS